MSDDLVKRAEQMMLEMQQLGYEVWPSIIRDLLADRRETALQHLSDMGQADERLDVAVKQARVDALKEAASECRRWRDSEYPIEEEAIGAMEYTSLILALITKDNTK